MNHPYFGFAILAMIVVMTARFLGWTGRGASISSSLGWVSTMTNNQRKRRIKRYLGNILGEVDSAALYRALSVEERKPEIAEVYKRLAGIEQAHQEFWKQRLSELVQQVPDFRVGWRTRALIWLARRRGPDFVLPIVSTREQVDVGDYDAQSEAVAGGLNAARDRTRG